MTGPIETAHDKLTEAIAEYCATTGSDGVLMEWVIVTNCVEPLADGSDHSSTAVFGSQRLSDHLSLGLFEYGATVVRERIRLAMHGGG